MMLELLLDRYEDGTVLMAGGALVGLLFGAAAQHSRFCLRAATAEFSARRFGPRLAIWLIVFFTAVVAVQAATLQGWIVPVETRQIGAVGSMSGAIIGGLMFGAGMILARGCASRLLVLSGTGNLRALTTGLVLTMVAQASLTGILSTPREALARLWLMQPDQGRDLLALLGIGPLLALIGGGLGLAVAIWLARREAVRLSHGVAAALVGVAVALGWVFTFAMTKLSFEPMQPGSVTFTGPSADTLMGLINEPRIPLSFSVGLVPGVFVGSALAALVTREMRLQGYEGGASMLRYFAGAALMGFGAMLAGGCAVGAGVTGGAIFATTAWVALTCMWLGAVLTNLVLNAWAAPPQAVASVSE